MKNKIVSFCAIALLAAGCNFTKGPSSGGVAKTINGGADWLFSNGPKTNKAVNLSALGVSKMAFAPNNHEIVYASGYNGGLYKSEDSGGNWSKILSKILVYDFAIDPLNPKTIYAAGLFGTFGKVLKSTDSGGSWQEIYNEPGADNPVRAVSLNPDNPSQLAIGTNSGSIIKSADGGLSWQLVKNFSSRAQQIAWRQNAVYVLLRNDGLYKSTDFGNSFQNISLNLSKDLNIVERYMNSINYDQIYNQFYVDSLASNLIYVTTGKGLYKSTDSGSTWTHLALPAGADSTNTRGINVAKTSSNLVFTSIGATIYKSTDGGGAWQTQSIASSGFVNYILIDPQLPQIVYAGLYVAK